MAILSWGKPTLYIKKSGATKWYKLDTPVENSTQLSTSKGDKKEAKVEGGENEAVKYNKNTYALAFQLRATDGRTTSPIPHVDGVVAGEYSLMLVPEDAKAPGFQITKSVVSVEDTYTAEDGAMWAYTFDALKDGENGQIKWGVQTAPSGAQLSASLESE